MIIDFLAKLKVYFLRAGTYVNIINFLLILATFKLTYSINISSFIVVPIGFLIVLLVGYIDYKIIMKNEIEHTNKQNDIKIQLDRIENMLIYNKK